MFDIENHKDWILRAIASCTTKRSFHWHRASGERSVPRLNQQAPRLAGEKVRGPIEDLRSCQTRLAGGVHVAFRS